MKYLINILFLVMVFFASCSPQRRLQRLLEHHPELMEQQSEPIILKHTDTLYIDSTTAQTEISPDEIENARGKADSMQADQVTIATATTDRATASLIYYAPTDKYSLSVDSYRDTVVFTLYDTIYVPRVIYSTEKKRTLKDTIYGGFGMVLISIILLIIIYVLFKKFLDNL